MKKLWLCLTCCCIIGLPLSLRAQTQKHDVAPPTIQSYIPAKGYVPDAKTAIRIAVAVWSPIYGEKKIQGEKPFKAELNKGVWRVVGSVPKGLAGGEAIALISKRDGRIIFVAHTQ